MTALDYRIILYFLILVGIPLVVLLLKAHLSLGKDEIRKTWLYPFFEFRDNLVRLRIEGFLDEEGYIFNYFYHMTNRMIQFSDKLNLSNVVRMLETIDDPKSIEEQVQTLQRMLANKDQKVKDLIVKFYKDLALFTIKNSKLVKMATDHRIYRILISNFIRRKRLYKLNQSYQRAAEALA